MKIPVIVYLAGVAVLFGSQLFGPKIGSATEDGEHLSPQTAGLIEQAKQVADLTDAEYVTRDFDLGYVDKVIATVGFEIVHDAALDRRVEVTGPAALLDDLQLEQGSALKPTLPRRIFRIDRPVTVRVNLTAHGSRYMALSEAQADSLVLPALRGKLRLATPLALKKIIVTDVAASGPDLPLETDFLTVADPDALGRLTGSAKVVIQRFELPEGEAPETRLEVGDYVRIGTRGGEGVRINL